jgi:hypothetical protein
MPVKAPVIMQFQITMSPAHRYLASAPFVELRGATERMRG